MSTSGKQVQDRSNFITRTITALIGGPLILIVTYLGGIPFFILGLVLAVLSLLEFCMLGTDREIPGNLPVGLVGAVALVFAYTNHQYGLALLVLLAVIMVTYIWDAIAAAPEKRWGRVGMTLSAVMYAALPAAFMILIRSIPQGLVWMILIFMLTWGTDTFAYLGGRQWGKHLLAPSISPKKTIEGAVVGVIGGFSLGIITLVVGQLLTPMTVLLAILAPPLAIAGDLFESRLKRYFHAGDSHLKGLNIIPGHGGVMDRTDALIWVATLFYVFFLLSGTII